MAQVLGVLTAASLRGWLDVKSLEPLLLEVIRTGHADNLKGLLQEIISMIEDLRRTGAAHRPKEPGSV